MAWIESHQTLPNHPKTRKAARLLKATVPAMVGHLHMLWYWSMDYAQDGDLTPFSADDIAAAAGWTKDPAKFIEALVACGLGPGRSGFLDRDETGTLRIHDWDQYIGRLLDKRRNDADRKRSVRSASIGQDADRTRSFHRTGRGASIGQDAELPHPGARTNQPTNQPNQPTTVASAGRDEDAGFRDRYGTLVTALGGVLDTRTADEFTQIAEDWPDIELISAAIRACRRDNKRPYPSEVRFRLPKLPKPPKPKRPDEPLSLDEFRAIIGADVSP